MARTGRPGSAPPVDVTCPHGHTFPTTAAAGNRIDCGTCRHEGRGRVRVRVPMRPEERAAREAARAARSPRSAPQGSAGASGPTPAAVDPGPPFTAADLLRELAADRPCPSCGAALVWTTGRTSLLCPKCRTLSLPHEIAEYHESRRTAEEKRRQRSAAPVAVSEAYDREAALALAEMRGRVLGEIADLRERVAPRGFVDRFTARDLAGIREVLAELDRQARTAKGAGELAEVAQLVARELVRAAEYERQAAPVVIDSGPAYRTHSERADSPRALPVSEWDEEDGDEWDEEDQEDEDDSTVPVGTPIFDRDTFAALAGIAGAGIYLLRNRGRNPSPTPALPPAPTYSTGAPIAPPTNRDYLCNYPAPWGACTAAVTAQGHYRRCSTHAQMPGDW